MIGTSSIQKSVSRTWVQLFGLADTQGSEDIGKQTKSAHSDGSAQNLLNSELEESNYSSLAPRELVNKLGHWLESRGNHSDISRSEAHISLILDEMRMLGPSARSCLSMLPALLRSKNTTISQKALRLATAMGPVAHPVLTEIALCLESTSINIRRSALLAVGAMGPNAVSYVPLLLESLDSEDEDIAALSASSLSKVSSANDELVGALLVRFQQPRNTLRLAILEAMSRWGETAQSASKTLADFYNSIDTNDLEHTELRRAILAALGEMGGEDSLRSLVRILANHRSPDRHVALSALKPHMHRFFPGLYQALLSCLASPDAELHLRALCELRHLPLKAAKDEYSYNARRVVARAALELKGKDENKRVNAADLLSKMFPESLRAMDMLKAGLSDPDNRLRASCVKAIGRSGKADYIRDVMHLLGDEDSSVRIQTIRALGTLAGAQASPMLAAFIPELNEPELRACLDVLTDIGTCPEEGYVGSSLLERAPASLRLAVAKFYATCFPNENRDLVGPILEQAFVSGVHSEREELLKLWNSWQEHEVSAPTSTLGERLVHESPVSVHRAEIVLS